MLLFFFAFTSSLPSFSHPLRSREGERGFRGIADFIVRVPSDDGKLCYEVEVGQLTAFPFLFPPRPPSSFLKSVPFFVK